MNHLATHAAQAAHYAQVRARLLRGPPPPPAETAAEPAPAPEPPRRPRFVPTPFDFLSPPHWRQLVRFCALRHRVAMADIVGPTRLRSIMPARHHAVFLCTTHTALSGSDIARRFGRDHSTVIHSVKMWGKLSAGGEAG